MQVKAFRTLMTLSALTLAAALTSDARVFMKVSGDPYAVVESAGGSRIYRADVKVNGIDAKLNVYAFKAFSETVGRTLLQRFGLNPGDMREGAIVKLPAAFGHAWLFVLPGMTGDVTSAMLIDGASDLSSGEPRWVFADLAQPPGFTPEFSGEDRESGMAVSIGSSEMQAGVAMRVVSGILNRAGWSAATPAAERTSSVLFARGDDVAVVCALPRDRGSSVLVMKKSK